MRKPWWLPKGWHAETWVCSMRGHVAGPLAGDPRFRADGFVRCVRCDAWVPAEGVDTTAKVGWPRRGKELHEAIVVRLIALDRALHAVILIPVGLLLGWLWLRLGVLTPQARDLAQGLAKVSDSVGHLGGHLNSVANRVASLRPSHIRNLAVLALAFGCMEGVEAVGLWLERRWAEYLTVVATSSLLPIEIRDIVRHPTALNVLGFAVNLAVVAYLIWSKRLFGARGGPVPRHVTIDEVAAAYNPQSAQAVDHPPG